MIKKEPSIAFWVDDLNEKSNFGYTSDIRKVKHNLKLLGDFKLDLEIRLPLTDKGITTVVPIGRFITVIELSRDEKIGRMTFFDFDTTLDEVELSHMLRTANYSSNVVREWFKVYDQYQTKFKEEDDQVFLYKPDLFV